MTDIGGLVRSVNPVSPGQSLLADDELDALLVVINERNDEAHIETLPRRVQPMRPRRRGWLVAAAVAVAVLVVLAPLLLFGGGREPDVGSSELDGSEVVGPQAVVEEFLDLYSRGQFIGSLELATAEIADRERVLFGGMEAWNHRAEQTEPCQEISPVDTGLELLSRFQCDTLDYDDFHAVGGLSPWVTRRTITVNEAGVISNISRGAVGQDTTLNLFDIRFMSWIREAHPEQAAQMSELLVDSATGVVLGLPAGSPSSINNFNSKDARIALQYVDEFVAQSDEYPIASSDSTQLIDSWPWILAALGTIGFGGLVGWRVLQRRFHQTEI